MILDQTYKLLKTKYQGQIENVTISDVRIGLFMTAIRLSDGSCGVAGNQTRDHMHGDRKTRDFGDFTPTRIKGRSVNDLIENTKKSSIIDALKIAAVNAISSRVIENDYKIIENKDPFDLLNLEPIKTVTIVGGFQSYIRKLSETLNKLYVLELNKDALKEDQKQYYVPAENYGDVLPHSDIVIITGLTLINQTIDGLLQAVKPGAEVIVTGPSANIIPDLLFQNNVTMIGATRILDPDLLFSIVGEGGAGFHLFERCAQKITILKDRV
jgi:uncharacterized protein